jgi:hypothetical protein
MTMSETRDAQNPTEAEFEQFVDALLKVDPEGLSGKHHPGTPTKKQEQEQPD